jgi:maltose/maltodextrin transport system substrate-binding protein
MPIHRRLCLTSFLLLASHFLLAPAHSASAVNPPLAGKASAPAEKAAPRKLVVWINGDKGYNGIAKVGQEYQARSGVEVVVQHPEEAPALFGKLAASGKGPDIWIWPHDRIGEWIKSGLISPIKPGRVMRNSIHPLGWSAFDIGGKTWGYPLSLEAIALIYNKDIIASPPKTFEEIPALDKKLQATGKRAIAWDYTNTYFTWPLLAAGGGYAFGHWDSGHYDRDNTGVNNAGSITGVTLLQNLVNGEVLPKTASYGEMEKDFHEGKLAMMINGPWAWDNAKKHKINFGVAVIPSVNGKAAAPFVGVLGAMIVKASPNKLQATDFLENHLLTVEGLKTMNADVPLGVPANREFFEQLRSNLPILETMASVSNGTPMPNNPEMGLFWSSMKTALENITQGKQGVRDGLDAAAKKILNKK